MTEKPKPRPKDFVSYGDGYADVTLSRPLDVDGAKVTVMRMREPTVDDQLVAEESKGSAAAKELTFMANLCSITPTDVRRLPVRDYARLQKAFGGFID